MADEAIVLASASPRRRALLAEAGLAFVVRPSGVDETLVGAPEPRTAATDLARRKAMSARDTDVDAGSHPRWYIGSDTIVAIETETGWQLLGKPADGAEAAAMLRSLSDTTHRVVTGVCVATATSDACAAETTHVTMRALTEDDIAAYVASGEWRDKAGGYAIQESADRFVTEIAGGGFDNVVGLPVALTLRLLRDAGAPMGSAGTAR